MIVEIVGVQGMPALDNALRQLPLTVERKLLRSAGRAGMAIMRRPLRRSLPRWPDADPKGKWGGEDVHLADSVIVVNATRSRRETRLRMTYRGLANLYGWRIEHGTHGTQPQPVWRRTFDAYRGRALQVAVTRLRKDIGIVAAKLGLSVTL